MKSGVNTQTVAAPRTVLDFVREHWAWAAPLVYVYVTALGMVQAWYQFQAFDLNIFEFSELNDFLLAAFREPISLIAVLGLVAYGALGVLTPWVFSKLRERRRDLGTGLPAFYRVQKWTMWGTFVAMVVLAPYLAPRYLHDGYGEKWKTTLVTDARRKVHVQLKDVKGVQGPDGWIRSVTLIGITGKFVFLYITETKLVLIVPLANVIAISKV